jgi:hypothetical protein
MFRCRPLLGRVPRAGSPTSSLVLRHSDFSRSRRRSACRSAPPFRLSPGTARPRQLLDNPSYACAGLKTPVVEHAGQDPGLAALRFGLLSVAFRVVQHVGHHLAAAIGARCRRPRTRCLRFAARLPVRLQTPRKTRFRLAVLHLGRLGIAPTGRTESFTSLHDDSLSPAFAGRKDEAAARRVS